MYVKLPTATDPISNYIQNNPKFFPFFAGALGALDGTHIISSPSAEDCHGAQNRKGWFSQNCLACCSFDLLFLYVMGGLEGSAADATVWMNARLTDLPIPANKFYLADAGFGACDSLLTPYHGV